MPYEKEGKRAKFIRVYAGVPENLRRDIVIVIKKKPYTWDAAYLEVKNNSGVGKKILKALEEMEVL